MTASTPPDNAGTSSPPSRADGPSPRWIVAAALALAVLLAGTLGYKFGQSNAEQGTGTSAASASTSSGSASGGKHVAFIGDSFSVGIGASTTDRRWTTQLSRFEGWQEENAAVSGRGYRVGSDEGKDYPGQVRALATRGVKSVDLVIISGGWNDVHHRVPTSEIAAGAKATVETVRKQWPSAKIVVLSPIGPASKPSKELLAAGAAIKPVVEKAGAIYIDLKMPLTGHPEGISPDGLHPNDAGYTRLATVTVQALRAAGITTK